MDDFVRGRTRFTEGWLGSPGEEKLDRALVAGLILEVLLENAALPPGRQARQRLVKSRLQNYLVHYLAGKVTLDRFRALSRRLEQWFDFYYPLLSADPDVHPGAYQVREPGAAYRAKMNPLPLENPPRNTFWDDLLDRWLEALRPTLPHRPHRKLSVKKLKEFLCLTGGGWFRLREFERFFQVDRKTAWDYLQQFLHAGLLCHNRKKSAAVRYCLAPRVLKVEADVLRLALSVVLPEFSEEDVDRLGDLLIATGGEPFRKEEWYIHFPPEKLENLLAELVAHNVLVLQVVPSGARLVRLHGRWLQNRPEAEPAPAGAKVEPRMSS